jgi:hypothetical protein
MVWVAWFFSTQTSPTQSAPVSPCVGARGQQLQPGRGGLDALLHVDQLVAHHLVADQRLPKVWRCCAQASASS